MLQILLSPKYAGFEMKTRMKFDQVFPIEIKTSYLFKRKIKTKIHVKICITPKSIIEHYLPLCHWLILRSRFNMERHNLS